MNMYDIYRLEDTYRDRKNENKRMLESTKKQMRSK